MSAAVIGLGLAVTACSRVEMGAAAIYGNQRITIASLDTQVTNLSQAARQYPGVVKLTPAQETQETLGWLIRFQIDEQVARQAGITVSPAQAQTGQTNLTKATQSQYASEGLTNVSLNEIMALAGLPPDQSAELGRWYEISVLFINNANGGTTPTTNAEASAAQAKFEHAECVAAKSLNILVNPQFGRLDYANYAVVSASAPVSRAEGPAPAPSLSGLAPAC